MIIGVTGGIGCGKSTVTRLLAALGCTVLDTDRVVADLYRERGDTYRTLVSTFGEDILGPDGEIDHRSLSTVLAIPGGAKTLNEIVHPAVMNRVLAIYNTLKGEQERPILVVEAPLLYEAGVEETFDAVVCVTCPEEEGIRRFASARNLPVEEARRRSTLQMPLSEKARRSDYIIDNGGNPEETEDRVREIFTLITEE